MVGATVSPDGTIGTKDFSVKEDQNGKCAGHSTYYFPDGSIVTSDSFVDTSTQTPYLARMIFCSLVIVGVLSKRRGRALRTPTTPRPASASPSAMTPTVRLSLNYCR